jgi:hypothetical protein
LKAVHHILVSSEYSETRRRAFNWGFDTVRLVNLHRPTEAVFPRVFLSLEAGEFLVHEVHLHLLDRT